MKSSYTFSVKGLLVVSFGRNFAEAYEDAKRKNPEVAKYSLGMYILNTKKGD